MLFASTQQAHIVSFLTYMSGKGIKRTRKAAVCRSSPLNQIYIPPQLVTAQVGALNEVHAFSPSSPSPSLSVE
jgi:hypothetical protein